MNPLNEPMSQQGLSNSQQVHLTHHHHQQQLQSHLEHQHHIHHSNESNPRAAHHYQQPIGYENECLSMHQPGAPYTVEQSGHHQQLFYDTAQTLDYSMNLNTKAHGTKKTKTTADQSPASSSTPSSTSSLKANVSQGYYNTKYSSNQQLTSQIRNSTTVSNNQIELYNTDVNGKLQSNQQFDMVPYVQQHHDVAHDYMNTNHIYLQSQHKDDQHDEFLVATVSHRKLNPNQHTSSSLSSSSASSSQNHNLNHETLNANTLNSTSNHKLFQNADNNPTKLLKKLESIAGAASHLDKKASSTSTSKRKSFKECCFNQPNRF
jgi:hypothetical protein